MYIVLAIIAFGIIIAVHELGHFLAAKAMNVKVLEFSVGMGPKLLSKQGKETLYCLRLVPFGGFCSMEGEYGERLEDDESRKDGKDKKDDNKLAFTDFVLAEGANVNGDDFTRAEPDCFIPEPPEHNVTGDGDTVVQDTDPRSFINQSLWRRLFILAAGSLAGIIMSFVIVLLMSFGSGGYIGTTITFVDDRLPEAGAAEILAGDKILTINGEKLYYYNDYGLFMNLNADRQITLTILRDGKVVEYTRRAYEVDGQDVYRYGLSFEIIPPTVWENIKYACYQTYNFMRMIRLSVAMMTRGDAGVSDLAGPVGIISTMNTVGQESSGILEGIGNIVYFTAFIGVNVAVINLLPIPAMDGGRILFAVITWIFEKITRRKLDPKYENYINTGAFALLIVLMVFIMFNDIMRLVS